MNSRNILFVCFLLVSITFTLASVQEVYAQLGTVLAGPFVPQAPALTGNGRGMAFDGTDLYYTIVVDSNIYKIDTSGNHIATIGIPGGDPRVSQGGPLAWDGSQLWTINYQPVQANLVLYRVNPATGATTFSCNIATANPNHPALPGLIFPDGLHWTGSQLVLSGEINLPTVIAFINPNTCAITSWFNEPSGNTGRWSGVAFDGQNLWHAKAGPLGGLLALEQTDVSGTLTGLSFLTSPLQIEDLEYDSVTFAPLCAVWGNQAVPPLSSNQIIAWEVGCGNAIVGGEILSIDATALLIAAAQTNAFVVLTAFVIIGAAAFGAIYYSTKKKN